MDYCQRLGERKITESNKRIIKNYIDLCKCEGIKDRRLEKYEYILSKFAEKIGMDINKVSEEDLVKFMLWLSSAVSDKTKKPLLENTKISFKIIISTFLGKTQFEDGIPKKLKRLLKRPKFKNNISPQDLFSYEDIQKILDQTQSIRRKAMISTLSEGALRPHELLSLRVGDVEFTDWGCRINIPKSKTVKRPIPLFYSAPLLAQYLNTHPQRTTALSPLWLNDQGKPMKQEGLGKTLKELSVKAGFGKKRIYSYLLRHSQLTEDAKHLKGPELQKKAGWKSGAMADTYIHLNDSDLEDKMKELHGIKKVEKETLKTPQNCPRCKQQVTSEARYCPFCGLCVDKKMTYDELKKEEALREFQATKISEDAIARAVKKQLDELLDSKKVTLEDLKNLV